MKFLDSGFIEMLCQLIANDKTSRSVLSCIMSISALDKVKDKVKIFSTEREV